jgi:hypothetical protein
MALDLLLDTDTHDLQVANYDLSIVEGLEQVRQKLNIRLQFFYGEWFLDTTTGAKLYDTVFVKNPNLRVIASMYKATILETPGVKSIIEYNQSYNASTRSLSVFFRVNTIYGELAVTEVV